MLEHVGDEEASGDTETLTSRMLAAAEHREIPLATIVTSVAVVVVTGLLLLLAWFVRVDLLLFGVAIFVAAFLAGPVGFLEGLGMRRSFATAVIFLSGLLIFAGIAFLFGSPLVSHVDALSNSLPNLVNQAEHGQGWVGHLIDRLHLRTWVIQNAPKLHNLAGELAHPALRFGTAAVSTVVRLVTILMLSYFLLLDLPRIWEGILSLLPGGRRRRVARVVHEASTGVTGYVFGNVATSVIAGLVVLIALLVFGVPFAVLLAVWVALVDLLPIVGALLAGIPTVLISFLHSPTAGIAVLVVFLVYQQVENHVLNPIIMSRTVRMSKLGILVTVVIAATLGGQLAGAFGTLIGALVGIPVGSAIQVIVREVRHPTPEPARVADADRVRARP